MVECLLAKEKVAGSNPVCRSKFLKIMSIMEHLPERLRAGLADQLIVIISWSIGHQLNQYTLNVLRQISPLLNMQNELVAAGQLNPGVNSK